MVGHNPSIQSFFSQQSPTKSQASSSPVPGDGFTDQELDAVINPTQQDKWIPCDEYEEFQIGSLAPGPGKFKVIGRIVNLLDTSSTSRLSTSAKGSFQIIVRDNTGSITIKLSYSKRQYGLQLGNLVTVWGVHIANGDRGMFPCMSAPLFVSIYPERDKSCHIRVSQDDGTRDLCRVPLNYEADLMSLKSFVNGGSEVAGAKILVVVKSIGTRKKVTSKIGTAAEVVSVEILDDTEEASLSLWGIKSASVSSWTPSETILLISSPGLNSSSKNRVSLSSETYVDVNPAIPEATYLRRLVQRMNKREHNNPLFPHDDYEAWNLTKPPEKVLYTLADVDARAREEPDEKFEGYLSVILTEINMTTLRQRNMFMSNECCGIPVYSNATLAKCKQCDQQVRLRINPRLVGRMIDETRFIVGGKVIMSDEAWIQLLGRSASEVMDSSADALRSVEQRMLFIRITLLFWWSEQVGRLVVLEVLE